MRKYRIYIAAILTMLSVCAGAASASAAPEWLVNGLSLMEKISDEGVKTTYPLTLEISVVKWLVECNVTLPGMLGAGGEGMISTSAKVTECRVIEGGVLEETELLHLPWLTELTLVTENMIDLYRDVVLSSGAGEPRWLIKIGGLDIVCEWEAGKQLFAEVEDEVGGTVDWTIHGAEAPAAKCTTGAGKLNGLYSYQLTMGRTLAASG